MNLNPLKKDDNTDALVKALEDANNMTQQPAAQIAADPVSTMPAMATPDDTTATIAADPQVVSAGVPSDAMAVTPDLSPATDGTAASAITEDTQAATDTTAGVSFSGNDLPGGLSDDADAHIDTPSMPSEGTGDTGELDTVKKSALEQLRPLIEKLDLEPADKFDKYLMMLRASDDPALIKPAFDAAQGIAGEKEKAQALLDIINEINYITTSQQG